MKKNHCITLLLCLTIFSSGIQAQRKIYDIKASKFSKADFEKLKTVLKGADPSTYSVRYVMNGRTIGKLGSASFDRLSTVAVYHAPGNSSDINEVLTTISNVVKTILTSKFNQAYPEKVTAINSILEASAVTGRAAAVQVDIRDANVSKADFEKLKASLAGADPSTYSLIYSVNGKQIDKAGSASFRSLTTVGAFHRPGSSSDINEVVTTISNYVKTILTSKFNQAYPEKLAQFNRELEGIASAQ